jgi:SAM-dependent methyltransferase
MSMKTLVKKWRFLPAPAAALYERHFLIRRALFKAIAPIARELRGDVLDFGCGSKPYRALFTACDRYVGVDIAVSGHNHAESEIDVYYDGKTLPFDDASFDAAVSFEVFEHVFNIDAMLVELRRTLKPGGRIVLTMPFAWPEHEVPYDFGRYTSFGIAAVMERAGFAVERIEKTNGMVEAVHQLWIEYVTMRLFLPLGVVGKLARIPFVALTNASAILLSAILPRDQSYYSNLLVCARRVDA